MESDDVGALLTKVANEDAKMDSLLKLGNRDTPPFMRLLREYVDIILEEVNFLETLGRSLRA